MQLSISILTSDFSGITTASYNLGCFFGAIFCIWIGNYLGRRKTIFTGSIIMVIGATLQACAYSLPHMIVGRIVTGIGNGMNTSTVRKSISDPALSLLPHQPLLTSP